MDVSVAVERLSESGITVEVVGEDLEVTYREEPPETVWEWLKDHKLELVQTLRPKPNQMRVYQVHVAMPPGDQRPPRWITMLAPGIDLDEATRSARVRFGEARVIEVRERSA